MTPGIVGQSIAKQGSLRLTASLICVFPCLGDKFGRRLPKGSDLLPYLGKRSESSDGRNPQPANSPRPDIGTGVRWWPLDSSL